MGNPRKYHSFKKEAWTVKKPAPIFFVLPTEHSKIAIVKQLCRALLLELQSYKDTVRCVMLGAVVPGHRQKQLTQTFLDCAVCSKRTRILLIVKSLQNRIELVSRPAVTSFLAPVCRGRLSLTGFCQGVDGGQESVQSVAHLGRLPAALRRSRMHRGGLPLCSMS